MFLTPHFLRMLTSYVILSGAEDSSTPNGRPE